MRGMWEGTPFPAFLLIKKVTKESDKLSKNKGSFRGDFYLIGKISCEIKNTRKTSFRNIRAFSCMFLSGFEPLAFRLGEQITLCPTIPLHYIPLRFVSI